MKAHARWDEHTNNTQLKRLRQTFNLMIKMISVIKVGYVICDQSIVCVCV